MSMKTYRALLNNLVLSCLVLSCLVSVPLYAQGGKKGIVRAVIKGGSGLYRPGGNLPSYVAKSIARSGVSLPQNVARGVSPISGAKSSTGGGFRKPVNADRASLAAEREIPTASRAESVIAAFHKLGNEDIDFSILNPDRYIPDSQLLYQANSGASYIRSGESLRLEAHAWGMPQYMAEQLSYKQLQEFITTARGMDGERRSSAMNSRWAEVQKSLQAQKPSYTLLTEEEMLREQARRRDTDNQFISTLDIENWARQQPDFVETNYISMYQMEERGGYRVPWNPAVKSLSVMIVNDEYSYVKEYINYAHNIPHITVTYVENMYSALKNLKENPFDYDIVLTDFHLPDGSGRDIAAYIHNNHLPVPVGLFSYTTAMPGYIYNAFMQARLPMTMTPEEVFNCASNLVATGKAYPDL